MQPAYLLDTNVVSYFVRGTSAAIRDHIQRTPLSLRLSCFSGLPGVRGMRVPV